MKALSRAPMALLLLLAACALAGKDQGAIVVDSRSVTRLHDRHWELKSITVDGRPVIMDIDANMTISFGADGKATGYASVNRFGGTYAFDEAGALAWPGRGFMTTRKAGPPELMEKENAYLRALPKVNRAILNGAMLQLQSDDGSTALLYTELVR
jgi:heat shock protein HslJ